MSSSSFNERFLQRFSQRLSNTKSAENKNSSCDDPMESLDENIIQALVPVFSEWMSILSEVAVSTSLWKAQAEAMIHTGNHRSTTACGGTDDSPLLHSRDGGDRLLERNEQTPWTKSESRRCSGAGENFFLGGGLRRLLRQLELPHHALVSSPWDRRDDAEESSAALSVASYRCDTGPVERTVHSRRGPPHEMLLAKTFGMDDLVPRAVDRGLLPAHTAARLRNALLALAESAPIYLYCGALFTLYLYRVSPPLNQIKESVAMEGGSGSDSKMEEKQNGAGQTLYSMLDEFLAHFHNAIRHQRSSSTSGPKAFSGGGSGLTTAITTTRTGSLLSLSSLVSPARTWISASEFRECVQVGLCSVAPMDRPPLGAEIKNDSSSESVGGGGGGNQDGEGGLLLAIAAEAYFDCCLALWAAYPSKAESRPQNSHPINNSSYSRGSRDGEVPTTMLESVMTFYVRRLKQEYSSNEGWNGKIKADERNHETESPSMDNMSQAFGTDRSRDSWDDDPPNRCPPRAPPCIVTSSSSQNHSLLRIGTLMAIALQRPIASAGQRGSGDANLSAIGGSGGMQQSRSMPILPPPPRLHQPKQGVHKRTREGLAARRPTTRRGGDTSTDDDEEDEEGNSGEKGHEGEEAEGAPSHTLRLLQDRLLHSHSTALASSILSVFAVPPTPRPMTGLETLCSHPFPSSANSGDGGNGICMSESRFRAGSLQWFTVGDTSLDQSEEVQFTD